MLNALPAVLLLASQLSTLLPHCSAPSNIPCESDLYQPVWRTFYAGATITKLDTRSIRRMRNGNVMATIYHAPRGLLFDMRHLVDIVTDCRGMMAVQGTEDMAPPSGTLGSALMREMCRRA